MAHHGDLNPGAVVDFDFTTVLGTGAPASLIGGALKVKKENSLTTSVSGVTLTTDLNLDAAGAVVGLNNCRITTASNGTFYSGGSRFDIIISAGTIGGISAIGYSVGSFSILADSSLKPTTPGETLDVTGGKVELLAPITEAGVATASAVAVWAAATRSLTEKTGFDLSSAGIVAIWSAAVRELSASGNTAVATALAGSFSSLTSALALIQADTATIVSAIDPTGAADIDTIKAAVDTEVAAIKAKTDQLTFTTPNVVDSTGSGGASAAAVAAAVWAKVIDTQGSITAQQAMDIILAVVAGVTGDAGLTFKSPNGSATRLVATVNALNERLTITLTPSA